MPPAATPLAAAADAPARSPSTAASVELAIFLAAAWAVLLVVGFIALRTSDALGASNRVSPDRAAFVSTNVGSIAGFVNDFAKPDDFAAGVRAVFVIQTLSGLLLSLIGGGVLLARLLGRPYSNGRLIGTALAMLALAAVGGCLTVRPGEMIGNAALRGLNALACGGVLFDELPTPGGMFSLALVPLSLIGSLGVIVLNDLFDSLRYRKRWPEHTAAVLTLTGATYVAGTIAMAVMSPTIDAGWPARFVQADAAFWSARAWGLPTAAAVEALHATPWTVVALMAVGVGTAGSAGAIGLGWLITARRGRLRSAVVNGLTAQILLAAAAWAVLAWFEPTLQPPRRLVLIVSAVMNLGLSHTPVSITGVGVLTLAFVTVAAKVLPLIVFASALRTKDAP